MLAIVEQNLQHISDRIGKVHTLTARVYRTIEILHVLEGFDNTVSISRIMNNTPYKVRKDELRRDVKTCEELDLCQSSNYKKSEEYELSQRGKGFLNCLEVNYSEYQVSCENETELEANAEEIIENTSPYLKLAKKFIQDRVEKPNEKLRNLDVGNGIAELAEKDWSKDYKRTLGRICLDWLSLAGLYDKKYPTFVHPNLDEKMEEQKRNQKNGQLAKEVWKKYKVERRRREADLFCEYLQELNTEEKSRVFDKLMGDSERRIGIYKMYKKMVENEH